MADIPDCPCGTGKMELRCAGPDAENPGRYYLKCPAHGQHPCSFKWYDTYRADNAARGGYVMDIQKPKWGEAVGPMVMPHAVGWKAGSGHICKSNSSSPIVVQVLIGFLGMVLVLLGFFIGKFM